MTVNLAFIGLGQLGLSAALALNGQSKEIRMTGVGPGGGMPCGCGPL